MIDDNELLLQAVNRLEGLLTHEAGDETIDVRQRLNSVARVTSRFRAVCYRLRRATLSIRAAEAEEVTGQQQVDDVASPVDAKRTLSHYTGKDAIPVVRHTLLAADFLVAPPLRHDGRPRSLRAKSVQRKSIVRVCDQTVAQTFR